MAIERYARHNLIDWFKQEDLQKHSVGVIGAGAVGNEIIKCLSLLGIGSILVCDLDTIEIHNLTRSVLFRDSDLGLSKAEVASLRATELDSNIKATSITDDFWRSLKLEDIQKLNCIFCCVDNFEARIKLNKLCSLLSIDLINIGIDSRFGSVEYFPFSSNSDSPCFECNLPYSVYARISQRYSCGWLRKVAVEEKLIPTTIITSSLAAAQAVSIFLHTQKDTALCPKSTRILIDSITGITTVTEPQINEFCPNCSEHKHLEKIYMKLGRRICNSIISNNQLSRDYVLKTSEQVLTKYRCITCDCESTVIFKAAEEFDEKIATCPTCSDAARQVVIKDQFTIGELIDEFYGLNIPGKYITMELSGMLIIAELQEEDYE